MEHYFSKKPSSFQKKNTIEFTHKYSFTFHTSSSVFSRKRVDKGTELLIKESPIPEEGMILDLGCGYGPVGIVLAKVFPKAKIMMSDVNERALSLAKENSEENKVKTKVVKSDLFENIKDSFDLILSNPPQSAGKELCIKLITDAKKFLKKGGSLILVVRHKKGGKHLSEIMEEVFGNVEVLGRKSGFRLYKSAF